MKPSKAEEQYMAKFGTAAPIIMGVALDYMEKAISKAVASGQPIDPEAIYSDIMAAEDLA